MRGVDAGRGVGVARAGAALVAIALSRRRVDTEEAVLPTVAKTVVEREAVGAGATAEALGVAAMEVVVAVEERERGRAALVVAVVVAGALVAAEEEVEAVATGAASMRGMTALAEGACEGGGCCQGFARSRSRSSSTR